MSSSDPQKSISGAAWLSRPETQRIFAAFEAAGEDVRAVGGAVRDTLMGREVTDVDFATPAPPERVMEIADRAGLKSIATGIDHGTVTLLAGKCPFEVTTLRRDVETDGRHATVSYTDSWEEDALRRDFTINALFADGNGAILDPLGGFADIAERRLNFVGEPRERLQEDYLRILRFFRFAAELEDVTYDEALLLACVQERGGLEGLSAERIQHELFRTLGAPGASKALALMFENGLLVQVLGGVPQLERLHRFIEIEHVVQAAAKPICRLAALALWVREDAARLCARFRLSNADGTELQAMAGFAGVGSDASDQAIFRGLYRCGRDGFLNAALLAWATSDAVTDDSRWQEKTARIKETPIPEFPVSGSDIVALGVDEGPRVGTILSALENRWMSQGFGASREDLLAFARTHLDDDA